MKGYFCDDNNSYVWFYNENMTFDETSAATLLKCSLWEVVAKCLDFLLWRCLLQLNQTQMAFSKPERISDNQLRMILNTSNWAKVISLHGQMIKSFLQPA